MTTEADLDKAIEGLSPHSLPGHVAVIMDGNGRWAKSRGWQRVRGHEEGAASVRAAVRLTRRLGIAHLTLYAFSEENWGRPKAEVSALMKLLGRYLDSERDEMLEKGIRLHVLGEIAKVPSATRQKLTTLMEDSKHCQDMTMNLALSYGGRQEIVRAAKALCLLAKDGELDPEKVDEDMLASHLYTAHLPDPDLLIRTSGELRTSNFLPWQLAYTEFYFTDTLWPDFREPEYVKALQEYARRQRRFGKTSGQIGKNRGNG